MEKYPRGWRGVLAKDVGGFHRARVQIPPSPPDESHELKDLVHGFFYALKHKKRSPIRTSFLLLINKNLLATY